MLIKPCRLTFSSTGGVIALGLAAKQWSVEACTAEFERLCSKAFTRRTGSNIPGLGFLVSHYNHSKYETRPLEEALAEAYGEDEFLFGGSRVSNGGDEANVKVAVISTSATDSPVVLANYNRLCPDKRELLLRGSFLIFLADRQLVIVSYHFQRPEKLESELKIWEA